MTPKGVTCSLFGGIRLSSAVPDFFCGPPGLIPYFDKRFHPSCFLLTTNRVERNVIYAARAPARDQRVGIRTRSFSSSTARAKVAKGPFLGGVWGCWQVALSSFGAMSFGGLRRQHGLMFKLSACSPLCLRSPQKLCIFWGWQNMAHSQNRFCVAPQRPSVAKTCCLCNTLCFAGDQPAKRLVTSWRGPTRVRRAG